MESVMRSLLPESVRSEDHNAKSQKMVHLLKTPTPEVLQSLGKKAPKQQLIITPFFLVFPLCLSIAREIGSNINIWYFSGIVNIFDNQKT
jgi:hypothetical protein